MHVGFLSGKGSVLNSIGEVEMDAVIMDGKTLSAGGVACVQNIANPVKLARMVMEKVIIIENILTEYTKLELLLLSLKAVPLSKYILISDSSYIVSWKRG